LVALLLESVSIRGLVEVGIEATLLLPFDVPQGQLSLLLLLLTVLGINR
jgi:hypothetical protein